MTTKTCCVIGFRATSETLSMMLKIHTNVCQQIMLSRVTWQQRVTLDLQFFFVVVVEILY